MSGDDPVAALREAARYSPDNVPLRMHLAEVLLGLSRAAEAETEYRAALVHAPQSQRLKLGLARAFFALGKHSECLVVIEDLVRSGEPPALALLLHARLLERNGERDRAAAAYRAAADLDPALADAELERALEHRQERVGVPLAGAEPDIAAPVLTVDKPTLDFDGVGGMDAVKEEIRVKIVYPLTHSELHRAYGKTAGGGILMYGPPGCGKTFLARATAGEIKAGFISVGINDVLDMWLGNSEKNLHGIFAQARSSAPCVVFFDEVDALAASRADMKRSASRLLINQFLAELDGIDAVNDGLLVLAATNAPWHLDPAFRRPGRFDRVLFVPPPDATARAAIVRVHCRGKPVEAIDFDRVAKRTAEFSGADLKAVVDIAVEGKLQQAMRDGVARPLRTTDLMDAAARVLPSTKEWLATARNYATYSNRHNLYDDVVRYLKMK